MLTGLGTQSLAKEPEAAGAEGETEPEPERGAGADTEADTSGANLRTTAEKGTGTEEGGGIYKRRKSQIQHLISKSETYN
jgi:hypothetical protein